MITLLLLIHSWYPHNCCADEDCHPAPCSEISAVYDGWTWQGAHFTRDMMKPSPDGACHVCVSKTGFSLCLFLKPEA